MNRKRVPTSAALSLILGFASCILLSCNYPAATPPTQQAPSEPTHTSTPAHAPAMVPPEGSVPSLDGTHYALIDGGDRLVIFDLEGREKELARSDGITHFSWFPDSRHIAYGDRVPSGKVFPMYEYRIWVVSIGSVKTNEIAKGFAPIVSPDGGQVAFVRGGRVGDACVVGFGLGVLELDERLRPISLLRQEDIHGIPSSNHIETFHPALEVDTGFPGTWRNESRLEVAMRWACKMDDTDNGVYVIDIGSKNAEKISELPSDLEE